MFDLSLSVSPTKAGLAPVLFAGDINKGIETASSLGYDAVEPSLLNSAKIDQDCLIDDLKEKNLKILAISTGQTYYHEGASLFGLDKEKRDMAVQRMKDHIGLAEKLKSMVLIGGIRGALDADPKKAKSQQQDGKEAIKECAVYAKDRGITLLLEPINRFETNLINTVGQAMELIEETGMDNIKILPDTFHMNIEEASIEDSLKRAGDPVGYMHFADSNRHAPGWGHTDFKSIIDTLKDMDYKGAIGVEVLPLPTDIEASTQGIAYLKKLLNKK